MYIYVPIEFDMTVDELRPDDVAYQHHIDEVVRNLLDDFDLPHLQVTGSVQDRAKQVIDAVLL